MIKLMYITNDIEIGRIVEGCDVDWVFVDLEYQGKERRQINRNTVISSHTIKDVENMRGVLKKSQLLVRINPIGSWSKEEIDNTIRAGADIVMLPYFKTKNEVEVFLKYINKRVKTCLLIETLDAIKNIEKILSLGNIDFIHIGLNDLHIERKTDFMFEFLGDGSLDKLVATIKRYNIPFGFGGMARIGKLVPPAEHILTEHYRFGSNSVILARSFCNLNDYKSYIEFKNIFQQEVRKIRDYEEFLLKQNDSFFEKNKIITKKEIYDVVNSIRENK